jgi:hypothetical protein
MKSRIAFTALLAAIFTGMLPAADPQLLGLVMPDAKVLAGVNLGQAKVSPFGQYILKQIQQNEQHLQNLITATGFDPTKDVTELLVAATSPGSKSGIVLARGNFDVAKIIAAATAKGATTESYKGLTILENPNGAEGIVFITPTVAAMGDLTNVKGAVDRVTAPASLPADLTARVAQWSGTEDAWVVSSVPPGNVKPPSGTGLPPLPQENFLDKIQQTNGGVKFGDTVAFTGEAITASPTDASQLAGVIGLLVNLAQSQTNLNTPAGDLLKSLVVTNSGNNVNLALSLPSDQFQQLLNSAKQNRQQGTGGNSERPRRRARPNVKQM